MKDRDQPSMFVYCLFLVVMFVFGLACGWYAQTYYWNHLVAPTPATGWELEEISDHPDVILP